MEVLRRQTTPDNGVPRNGVLVLHALEKQLGVGEAAAFGVHGDEGVVEEELVVMGRGGGGGVVIGEVGAFEDGGVEGGAEAEVGPAAAVGEEGGDVDGGETAAYSYFHVWKGRQLFCAVNKQVQFNR